LLKNRRTKRRVRPRASFKLAITYYYLLSSKQVN